MIKLALVNLNPETKIRCQFHDVRVILCGENCDDFLISVRACTIISTHALFILCYNIICVCLAGGKEEFLFAACMSELSSEMLLLLSPSQWLIHSQKTDSA